jgi:hypothetical protein
MQESESLFDVVLDQIVEPMPRAEIPAGGMAIISCPMPRENDSEGVTGETLQREHPPAVREILRRAGLSMEAELEPQERWNAEAAVRMFRDKRTPSATIRDYIMLPIIDEGVTG